MNTRAMYLGCSAQQSTTLWRSGTSRTNFTNSLSWDLNGLPLSGISCNKSWVQDLGGYRHSRFRLTASFIREVLLLTDCPSCGIWAAHRFKCITTWKKRFKLHFSLVEDYWTRNTLDEAIISSGQSIYRSDHSCILSWRWDGYMNFDDIALLIRQKLPVTKQPLSTRQCKQASHGRDRLYVSACTHYQRPCRFHLNGSHQISRLSFQLNCQFVHLVWGSMPFHLIGEGQSWCQFFSQLGVI